jgi:hypothetical protein
MASLRGSYRARAGTGEVHQCSRQRTVATGCETDFQVGRSCGANVEVGVAEFLCEERVEGDRLIGPVYGKGSTNVRRRVVVIIAAL